MITDRFVWCYQYVTGLNRIQVNRVTQSQTIGDACRETGYVKSFNLGYGDMSKVYHTADGVWASHDPHALVKAVHESLMRKQERLDQEFRALNVAQVETQSMVGSKDTDCAMCAKDEE